jgi:hypothetical protein
LTPDRAALETSVVRGFEIPADIGLPRSKLDAASVVLALAFGLAAAAGALWSMRPPGPGLDPDSMSYLAAADSLARAGELRVPFAEWSSRDSTARLRDFAPGLSVAIAALETTRVSSERSATWVEAASAFATVAGSTLLVSAATTPTVGAAAAVVVLVTPALIEDHTIVLSEPLFLALLVGVLALASVERPRASALGVVAGAAVMVRYAGLSLVLAAAARGVLAAAPRRRRLLAAALAGAPGLLAFVLWNRWAGKVRDYGWKGNFGATLLEGWGTLQEWLVPGASPSRARVGLAIAVLGALVFLVARGGRRARVALPAAFRLLAGAGIVAASYVALVTFSRLFADAAIPFDNRIVSPLFLVATLAVATAIGVQWGTMRLRLRTAVVVAAGLWCVASARVTLRELRDLRLDGWGYASAKWIGSDLRKWLLTNGAHYELFSDNSPSLYSLTHRSSRSLPESIDPQTMRRLAEILRDRPSAVIAFQEPDAAPGARGEDFARRLMLQPVFRAADGTVFVLPSAPPSATP